MSHAASISDKGSGAIWADTGHAAARSAASTFRSRSKISRFIKPSIVVAPCGYDIETTQREVRPLARYALWQELRAVRDRQVYIADGNAYFNRPGPRV